MAYINYIYSLFQSMDVVTAESMLDVMPEQMEPCVEPAPKEQIDVPDVVCDSAAPVPSVQVTNFSFDIGFNP